MPSDAERTLTFYVTTEGDTTNLADGTYYHDINKTCHALYAASTDDAEVVAREFGLEPVGVVEFVGGDHTWDEFINAKEKEAVSKRPELQVCVMFMFPNHEIAQQFMSWMDGAGEQWHWQHADDRGEPKLTFDYNYQNLMVKSAIVEDDDE